MRSSRAAAVPHETGGTAESWSKGQPAFIPGASWERVLAEPGGGGKGSAQYREGGCLWWQLSGCLCKGKGRGVGPGRAGGRTLRLHSPLTLASRSTGVPGEAGLRSAQSGSEKRCRDLSLLPGRKEGERSKPAEALKRDPATGASLGPTLPFPTYMLPALAGCRGHRLTRSAGIPVDGAAEAPGHGKEHIHALAAPTCMPPLGGGHDRPLRSLRALQP